MSGVRIRDRATGDIVTVDAGDAQAAVVSGSADLVDRTVHVTGSGGKVGTVDAKNFVTAFDEGWSLADSETKESVRRQAEAQSLGGQVRGGAEALARGVSVGLSDAAARSLGADMEAMRDRQEAVGLVGTGLEVAGAIAPTLVSGGGGAAATAARMTPAALAARAGGAAARRVGGGGLARAGAAAAVEGGLVGAGQAVSEAALWDRDVTAEDLAGGALVGSALGLGSVVGMHGLARAARGTAAASTKGYQKALQALSPHGDEVSAATAKSVKKLDVVRDPKLRRAATDTEGFRKEVTGNIQSKYTRARSLADEADDLVRQAPGKLKKVDMADVDPVLAMRSGHQTARVADERLAVVAGNPAARKQVSRIRTTLREALEAEKPDAVYRALDEVGGIIEREASVLEKTGRVEAREAAMELRTVSDVLDSVLDDRSIWKGAVDSRQAVRATVDDVLAADKLAPAGLQGGKADPTELLGLARKGDVDATLQARLNHLEAVAEQRSLPKSTVKKIDEAKKEIEALRRELKAQGRNAEALEVVDQLGRVDENFALVSQFSGLLGAGAFAGKIASGLGLGGIGLGSVAVSALVRPKAMLSTVASMVDFAGKLGARRNTALEQFGKRLARKSVEKAKSVGPRISTQAALKVAREVARLDVDSLMDVEADSMRHLADIAPNTAIRAQATLATAVEFLRSKAPAQVTAPWGGKSLVDPIALDRYRRYVEGVADPGAVWDRLAMGTLAREHVEALRAVYPAIYRDVQNKVMDTLGELTKPPPYRERITLGTLLDLPTDPSLAPRHLAAVQAAIGGAPPQEQQQGAPAPSGRRPLAGGARSVTERASNLTPPGSAHELRKE